jgi:hypothetical protein
MRVTVAQPTDSFSWGAGFFEMERRHADQGWRWTLRVEARDRDALKSVRADVKDVARRALNNVTIGRDE